MKTQLKKTLTVLAIVVALFSLSSQQASAISFDDVIDGVKKIADSVTSIVSYFRVNPLKSSKTFGSVDVGIVEYNDSSKGVMPFVNNFIMFSAAVASLWLLVVIIINGINIINNKGKGPEAIATASRNIMLSIAGLVLSSLAFILTQYVSQLLFGSATYLVDPIAQMEAIKPQVKSEPIGSKAPTAQDVFGTPTPQVNTTINNDYSTGSSNFIANLVNFITALAAVWLLFSLIWNGIQIITSNKPDTIATAVRNITISIIGFIVVTLAYVITSFVTTKLYNNATIFENPTQQLPTNTNDTKTNNNLPSINGVDPPINNGINNQGTPV